MDKSASFDSGQISPDVPPAPGKMFEGYGPSAPARVAILLSTYNGERYLADLLDSLCRQRYRAFDLYVRDDGSSDGSVQVMRQFDGKLSIRNVECGENLGVAASFFALLERAGDGYDYYAFCDQDDVWLEEKVLWAVESLDGENQSMPLLYCGRLQFVSADLKPLGLSRRPRKTGFGNALVENAATGCATVINSKARDILLERRPQRILMHDWWMYLVISAFGQVTYDPRPLLLYRQHESNTVGAATTFIDDYAKRLRRFFATKPDGTLNLSGQVEEFVNLFADRLTDHPGRNLLSRVLRGKRRLASRILLCLDPYIWRQSPLDQMILKLLFLMNRY